MDDPQNNAPQTADQNNLPQTGQVTVPPPPAAAVVVSGENTEEVNTLRSQLETERQARRKAETDAAYAQDEARRLKEVQSQRPAPTPAPANPKRAPWLPTLLHESEGED